MSASNMKGLIRAAVITLPVGLALLIGGGAAIAAKQTAIGAVLIVLAVGCVCVGCVLMLQVRNRARAFSRDMQARQQASLDTSFRDYQNLVRGHGDRAQAAVSGIEQAPASARRLPDDAVR